MTISATHTMEKKSSPTRTSTGIMGEDYAAQYLTDLGWTILERNWRCRYGELDIIALCPDSSRDASQPQNVSSDHTQASPDPRNMRQILVFVEVKTRTSLTFGDPLESITPRKCQHMRRAGISWLAEHQNALSTKPILARFDGIGITVSDGKIMQLTHVRRIA